MTFALPTLAQASAFGRHVVSYVAGAITVGVAFHFVSPDQGTQLTTGITQIVNGIETTVGGIATVASVGAALYAAWTASPRQQLLAVAANPDVQKVIAKPAVAETTPSDKVVAR